MNPWKIGELKRAVAIRHGADIGNSIGESLQSLSRRQEMSIYHSHEFREQASQFSVVCQQRLPDEPVIFAAMASLIGAAGGEPHRPELERIRLKVEANLIAAAQAVHALADILAVAIYYALKLDVDPKGKLRTVRDVSIREVARWIEPTSANQKLIGHIDDFRTDEVFEYLSDFVNSAKHIQLIHANPNVDFIDNRFGFKIQRFSKRRKGALGEHAEKWAEDFVLKDLQSVREKIHEIGLSVSDAISC